MLFIDDTFVMIFKLGKYADEKQNILHNIIIFFCYIIKHKT